MKSADGLPIRLVLLDDHDGARHRAVDRLGQHPQLVIVGDTAGSSEALELAQELKPDAVLVETHRLDNRGMQAISLLSTLGQRTRPAVVAYLEIVHRGDWPAARAAGADDVLLQEMPPWALARELRHVVDRLGDGD
jgi:DNA-binding NarL/FixJ family response regulator